jgi:translation elongation factor EF-Tu-like GTPase
MGKDQDPSNDEIQREILAQQEFSMESAISRAGSGLMKGESPISQQEQAIIELTQWIDQQTPDPSGALKSILRRQVRGNRP